MSMDDLLTENGQIVLETSIRWTSDHKPGACNPSYSGGRDPDDQGSKPAQANSCETLS
jgi:hypothetical protein